MTNSRSHILKGGNKFFVRDKESMIVLDALPAGNYVVKYNEFNNEFFLETSEPFVMPTKLYGKTNRHAERIMETYNSRQGSTGVLLTGEKGSGKTLLAKQVCTIGAKAGMPTLIVNNGFAGDSFNQFIQSISQPAIIMFDEFEKVYDKNTQPHLLTLLDGVFAGHKLFLLTCNDKYRIDNHMRNRPGRLYYSLDFDGLDREFIREYCQDRLTDTSKTDSVVRVAGLFGKFNFDMLQAIVEEMNRYGESVEEVVMLLNAKPELDGNSSPYKVEIMKNGVVLETSTRTLTPLDMSEEFCFRIFHDRSVSLDDDDPTVVTQDLVMRSMQIEQNSRTIKPNEREGFWEEHSTSHFEVDVCTSDITEVAGFGDVLYAEKDGFTIRMTRQYGKSGFNYNLL